MYNKLHQNLSIGCHRNAFSSLVRIQLIFYNVMVIILGCCVLLCDPLIAELPHPPGKNEVRREQYL